VKKILITLCFLVLQITPAQANECPAGAQCALVINCTTGERTIEVISTAPFVVTPKIDPVITSPTHKLSVQTVNQSFGVSGTPEQIQETVNQMVAKVVAPIEIDPCVNGGCNRTEINATTKEVTVLPLTKEEIQQRSQDKLTSLARNAEITKAAAQALPNIEETDEITPLSETEPDWWSLWLLEWAKYTYWFYSYNWQL
jgi:hypothetical protein